MHKTYRSRDEVLHRLKCSKKVKVTLLALRSENRSLGSLSNEMDNVESYREWFKMEQFRVLPSLILHMFTQTVQLKQMLLYV